MKKTMVTVLMTMLVFSTSTVGHAATENSNINLYDEQKIENIEDKKTQEFVDYARLLKAQETPQDDENGGYENAFLYQYADAEAQRLYVYEDTGGEESVAVVATTTSPAESADPIPDGIGARQKIKAHGSTYISGTFELPDAGTVKVDNTMISRPYLYAGFTGGSQEGDMGLTWSTNNGNGGTEGWKPYGKVGDTPISENLLVGYDQVIFKNSYLPGTDVGFYVYSNYDNTGKVRLKTMGMARYADKKGNGSNTFLTAIIEYSTSVGTPTHFKVLATIATKEGTPEPTGSYTATVSELKVGGAVPSESDYETPTTDKATLNRNENRIDFTLSN